MTRAGLTRSGLGRVALAVVVTALVATGCSTGHDAVAEGGTFQFVSPGGKTVINYDPPSARGSIGDLSGPDLLGQNTTLSVKAFAGDVVVLNIWGQWCGPCRTEAADLQQVYDATKSSGVRFLGIDVKDPNLSAPQDFVRNRGITYPSIYDPAYRTLVALGGNFPTSTTPATIVLDRQHRVAVVFLEAVTADQLLPVVKKIAAEAPAPSA